LNGLFPKSTQSSGASGGQISPGSTRRLKGLARGLRSVTSQGFPFVGWVRTTGGMGQPEEEADLGRADHQLMRYPQQPPDFPAHGVLEYRDELGISRQGCRKFCSVSSLLSRRYASSHVRKECPTVGYIRPGGTLSFPSIKRLHL
jgi:hypothetical protein